MTENVTPSPQVTAAAQWLAVEKDPPAKVVPTLRKRFGLTGKEACEACALAQSYRGRSDG